MLLLSFFDKGKKRQKYYKVLCLAKIGLKYVPPPPPLKSAAVLSRVNIVFIRLCNIYFESVCQTVTELYNDAWAKFHC